MNQGSARHLVLLGAGHAHIQVLAALAESGKNPLPGDVRITLVTPYPRQMYSGMVPGLVAGHYQVDDCAIALEPLLHNSPVHWLRRRARAVVAAERRVVLDDGSELHYDWLSINTGPVQNRALLDQGMPGVRDHGLFVRPIEAFATLWPQVAALGDSKPLRLAVVGAGAAGLEMAWALRHRLPQSAVTLIGSEPPGHNYPPAVQARIARALRQRHITFLQDRVCGVQPGALALASGASLACDVPLIATPAQAPDWLQGSGLALDAQGFVAVDAFQRSSSHPEVFAAGDVSTRSDRPLARSGVYAVRAGPALLRNLRAVMANQVLRAHQPPAKTLNLLACGERYAIGSWGGWSAEGRWVWWLKDWIDRRFMARWKRPSPP